MEEGKVQGKTRFVEPNKKEFKNHIFRIQEEMMEGYVEMLRSGAVMKRYNDVIPELIKPETTLEDRSRVEVEYIKKDLEYLSQCYFNNYINYQEYLFGIHNVLNAFNVIRHNWNIGHPAPEQPAEPQEDK